MPWPRIALPKKRWTKQKMISLNNGMGLFFQVCDIRVCVPHLTELQLDLPPFSWEKNEQGYASHMFRVSLFVSGKNHHEKSMNRPQVPWAFALSSGSYNQANDQSIQTEGLSNRIRFRLEMQKQVELIFGLQPFLLDCLVTFFAARTWLTTCFLFFCLRRCFVWNMYNLLLDVFLW